MLVFYSCYFNKNRFSTSSFIFHPFFRDITVIAFSYRYTAVLVDSTSFEPAFLHKFTQAVRILIIIYKTPAANS